MIRVVLRVIICLAVCADVAGAQGRGSSDWMTDNADAQRSSWIRTDAKISRERLQKPGFQLVWKVRLNNKPKQLNSLAPPSLLELLIGYRGFRTLAFVGGSSDNVFAIDTDLARIEWQKKLTSSQSAEAPGTPACPGGMTASVTRPTIAAIAPPSAGGISRGRGGLARSAVGEPGQGAVTLALVPPPRPQPASPPRPATPPPPSTHFTLVYALSSDGSLHTMHLSNGEEAAPPVKFLPPNANAQGLTVIDNVAYVVTEQNCAGVPNGVWALDLSTKQVSSWQGNIAGSAGPAFGPDGTIYVTTGAGAESPYSLVALHPKTLEVKGKYTPGNDEFTSSPVIFMYKGKVLIAAATKDGRVHLLDSESFVGGAVQQKPLYQTPAFESGSADASALAPGALSSWQASDGTRWLLAPIAGAVSAEAGFTAAAGGVTRGAIVTWKLVEKGEALTLQPGWISRDLISPLSPTIINGVVFAISSGEFRTSDSKISTAQRVKRSSPAVLYALDGMTGKELWNSGTTITSFVRGGSLSGGSGQIYVGGYDGTLYAFGFPMEH